MLLYLVAWNCTHPHTQNCLAAKMPTAAPITPPHLMQALVCACCCAQPPLLLCLAAGLCCHDYNREARPCCHVT